jgi:CDP-glycerol glycerophosphotransferase (TagB/SpsB family)
MESKSKNITIGFPFNLTGHCGHSEPVRAALEKRGYRTIAYRVTAEELHKGLSRETKVVVSKTDLTIDNYHTIPHHLGNILPKPIIHMPHGASIWKSGVYVDKIDYNLAPSELWIEHNKYLEGNRIKDTYYKVGLPKLDSLVNSLKHRDDIKSDYIKDKKLDPSKPVIAFLPTWFSESSNQGMGTLLHLDKIKHNSIPNFVVAPHTSDYNLQHPHAFKIVNNSKYYDVSTNKDRLLLSSDIIVGDISSMLIEALVVDKPIVHIHKNNIPGFCICSKAHLGLLLLGNLISMESLPNSINCLLRKDVSAPLRHFWKDRLLYKADGKTLDRVCDAVEDIIRKDKNDK